MPFSPFTKNIGIHDIAVSNSKLKRSVIISRSINLKFLFLINALSKCCVLESGTHDIKNLLPYAKILKIKLAYYSLKVLLAGKLYSSLIYLFWDKFQFQRFPLSYPILPFLHWTFEKI